MSMASATRFDIFVCGLIMHTYEKRSIDINAESEVAREHEELENKTASDGWG